MFLCVVAMIKCSTLAKLLTSNICSDFDLIMLIIFFIDLVCILLVLFIPKIRLDKKTSFILLAPFSYSVATY